jgi:hypothetical protein
MYTVKSGTALSSWPAYLEKTRRKTLWKAAQKYPASSLRFALSCPLAGSFVLEEAFVLTEQTQTVV